MKLSAEQIAQIKSWISKRGFTHTDVQYEIIDHVASAIEDKIDKDPDLTLEIAFKQVHKSFGVFGFQTIEESIASKLNKELRDSYGRAIKQIFTSEKILIPFLFILSLISFHQSFPEYFKIFCQSIFIVSTVGALIYYFVQYRQKKYIKNYLSFKMAIAIIPNILVVVGNLSINFLKNIHPNYAVVIFSILVIVVYAVILGTNQMIEKTEKLHKLYKSN